MGTIPYVPIKTADVQQLEVRGLRCQLSCWGNPDAPVLMLLHGWGDCGGTFQFLADALPDEWYLVAPDWRGFGGSEWAVDGYWFPDYVGDLEMILNHFAPGETVALVGHSMGGHISSLYAGIRPERVRTLINIEGFGPPRRTTDDVLSRYELWLDGLTETFSYRPFKSLLALATHLQARHRWLSEDKALFVARCWATESNGEAVLRADPLHKRVTPYLYRQEDVRDCCRTRGRRSYLSWVTIRRSPSARTGWICCSSVANAMPP